MDAKVKECSPEIDSTVQLLPKVGMLFQSEDCAYNFYNQYAKAVGFSVRKDSSTVRADGTVLRRVLCCSKQGLYKDRRLLTNVRVRSRTGCEARIIIRRHGEKFLLIEFNEFHNHELVPPSEVHRLRSQRKIEDSQARIMRNMYHEGIGPADIYSSMCKRVGGPQNLSFTKLDCVKFLQKIRHDDTVKNVVHSGNSMVVGCHPSLEKCDDCGTSMIVDCKPFLRKGDGLGTSTVSECYPSSTFQCNDLAHMALTIVAKGNTSEKSAVFARKLLTQALEELDSFIKYDSDKMDHLVDIRNMNHDKRDESKKSVTEVGASIRLRNPPHNKSYARVSAEKKAALGKGKGKKRFPKTPKGSYDQESIGAIGTTLLMLQDSSVLPKHHHNQVSEQPDLPQDSSM
ncbi:hypothetical protein AQUCO_00100496v1 [Aquilegia coerulea]|nr:hypothetical protein AQUCO_00100496v1 [Aquilegia coerulea]